MKEKKYFGEDVDNALVEYQKSSDIKEKNKVFEKKIMPAFKKLISYYYFTMPINRDEEVQFDCLSFLFEQLNKFDTSQKRGFPYFNVVAKNYFIQKLKQEKKKAISNDYIFSLDDTSDTLEQAELIDSTEHDIETKQFVVLFKENLNKWRASFQKEQEVAIVDALITLFDNIENIDVFNEKAIYHYLKEITGLNSTQIAINLNKIRKKFYFFNKKYERGEF